MPHFISQKAANLTGGKTSTEPSLLERFERKNGAAQLSQFASFLEYLEKNGIILERNWLATSGLDEIVVETQQRQLAFLLDILGTPEHVIFAQKRISNAKITVVGVGAVGSWIVRLLLSLGFRKFVLVDHGTMDDADVSRHAFFDAEEAKNRQPKPWRLAEAIDDSFAGADIRTLLVPLTTSTDLDELIDTDTDLVINSADEPYIGYTSVLLSRYCIQKGVPLLVAGGFDAHLGSLGELIIPGVTPCSDCYADFFSSALAGWKPISHPVANRSEDFGGLCSLTVFSAAAAAMSVLRLFSADTHSAIGGRGELLFDDYRLDRFVVERQPNCVYCQQA